MIEEQIRRELHRLPPEDARAIRARRVRLRGLMGSVPPQDARALYERLRIRRAGDELSERFHDMLASAVRRELVTILGRRIPARHPQPPAAVTRVQDLPNYIDNLAIGVSQAPYTAHYHIHLGGSAAGRLVRVPASAIQRTTRGNPAFLQHVFPSHDASLQAHANLLGLHVDTHGRPLGNTYVFIERNGVIFPTLYSEESTPRIMEGIRRKDAHMQQVAREALDVLTGEMISLIGAGVLRAGAHGFDYILGRMGRVSRGRVQGGSGRTGASGEASELQGTRERAGSPEPPQRGSSSEAEAAANQRGTGDRLGDEAPRGPGGDREGSGPPRRGGPPSRPRLVVGAHPGGRRSPVLDTYPTQTYDIQGTHNPPLHRRGRIQDAPSSLDGVYGEVVFERLPLMPHGLDADAIQAAHRLLAPGGRLRILQRVLPQHGEAGTIQALRRLIPTGLFRDIRFTPRRLGGTLHIDVTAVKQ